MFFSKGNRLNNIFALSYRNLRKKSKFRPSGYGVACPCRRLQCPENGKITTANFTVSFTLSLSRPSPASFMAYLLEILHIRLGGNTLPCFVL